MELGVTVVTSWLALRLQVEVALNAARMATWRGTVRMRTIAVEAEAAAVSGVFEVIASAYCSCLVNIGTTKSALLRGHVL